MAEGRRYALSTQLDIEQILLEAQSRWLRPPEICEILRNYHKFRIAPEPPNKPPSGSLFLFDRKVLRYFRKDGHNWRKKKDGKTVKEAHERLKAGSVDVLHCYYAHGEENENFQRRSYWLLEEDLMHIVLVHYREVKGNKVNYSRTRDSEETYQVTSRTMDTSSLNSVHTSELDDSESDNHQASSRYCSFLDEQSEDRPAMNNPMDAGLLNSHLSVSYPSDYHGKQLNVTGFNFMTLGQDNLTRVDGSEFGLTFQDPGKQNCVASWVEALEHTGTQSHTASIRPPVSSTKPTSIMGIPKPENVITGHFFTEACGSKQQVVASPLGQAQWQIVAEDDSSNTSTWPMDQNLDTDLAADLSASLEERKDVVGLHAENGQVREENLSYSSSTRHHLIDCSKKADDDLKKLDSFSRWMSKELEVDGAHVQSSSGIDWNIVENGNVAEDSGMSSQGHLDAYLLSPSLSQDQLFSILDFSPNWVYAGMETKVLVTGMFLRDKNDAQICKWSCMFGEVEVPAEVLADGVLRCCAPVHGAGRVPFYVTCSNRVACSEVREFEYRIGHTRSVDTSDINEMFLRIRLGKLLSLESIGCPNPLSSTVGAKSHVNSKISSLLKENDNEWLQIEKLATDEDFCPDKVEELLLQKILKEKLHGWLLHKVAEDGKGPNVLDKEGQGVLHLAAALGYDWAIAPTIAAGVNINFRDVDGWTALHWAAFCGRERTVVALVSLGGAPGALTHPTPKFPSGRTPADLASSNGHKGIAGYLAESSLTSHLSSLTLETSSDGNTSEVPDVKAVQTVAEWSTTQFGDDDGLSLKDSLSAVRNAAQAAARIHEVFRVQSFQRKQLIEFGDDKFEMSDEQALSLISVKSNRTVQYDEPIHTAAIRIQNKFRGWKGRKDFLIIRQRIVKIQALVRGHQVRKHYRKIVWSVGIVEKVILRWRRKGSGLRGFRPGLIEDPTMQSASSKEDDYDFLKEGRKQTEARLDKALARVRSMVQYPEARDQYRRLLNGVTEFQETKVVLEKLLNSSEEAMEGDDMIDIEMLLGDDTIPPTVS
ncbi:calmodulin-binding transcription activator 3-like protein isoform X1 [Cinnamomum micranthum f. kanehirae]|uniref:Calmodulin-binding transcription activator 3-like protein isoform X1 n=1 Tax=Cinnamomum micranthum f. kanehirae TaxID=337451 RepID=A0A3S3ND67_9MAGN|nr:calmodulin-binding transcription activator 3-like protein isoform X1 [Cinnamomum micranthum f. kanehirae]